MRKGRGGEAGFEVFERSIEELARALRSGETNSVGMVDAYLDRIEAFDRSGPALRAVIRVNPRAHEEAAALDQERAAGRVRGPLHGIPVLLKDNFDTADLPTTAGAVALAEHRPREDAAQVKRLREAGAVLLGKTNMTELAYGITSASSLGGQTLNAYNPGHNPGGSSGGTASAIAASFAAVGWGTDTCGSIRIPAAVSCLYGLRPTPGLFSGEGIVPLCRAQDQGGPLARRVHDLAVALDATREPAAAPGYDRPDAFAAALGSVPLEGVRIGVLHQLFGAGPEEVETTRLVHGALAAMRAAGAEVIDLEIPELEERLEDSSLIQLDFKWDLADYLARTPDTPVRSLGDIIADGRYHPIVESRLRAADLGSRPRPEVRDRVLERRARLRQHLLAAMDAARVDVVAYPALRGEARPIGEPAQELNCQLSAGTGTPALALPAGFTRRGVPVGLELLGRPLSDLRLVALAAAYEAEFRPRRPPATTPPLRHLADVTDPPVG